jgi:hypothetical protein
MPHPLNGARLKVVRAQEHLDTLKLEIDRYLKSKKYLVTPIQNESGDWGVEHEITANPDPRFSAIIGDCLHNARCALDYIMWEVAGTFAQRVLVAPPQGTDKPYFPIYDNPAGFKKSIPALSKYKIPDPVIAEFEAVQAYKAGYEALWLLHTLVNVDKHRLPLTVIGEFDRIELTISRLVLGPGAPPPPPPYPGMLEPDVQTQATVFVSWEDLTMPREPVDLTIENMIKSVANVIPRFDGFVL